MSQPTLYKGNLIIPDDPRVSALIPHAKKIVHEGKEYTVVPHKLDEFRVLRNLGFDLQPPIMSGYTWPIVNGFQPFDAQRWTAAMISVNDVSYVLNDLGCVDALTEVLTPTGWTRIDQWDGQPVAQYWPETGTADFVESPQYVKLPCEEMLVFTGSHGLEMHLSLEHRMLMQTDGGFTVQPAILTARDMQRNAELLIPRGFALQSVPSALSNERYDLPCSRLDGMTFSTPVDGFKYCFMVPSTFLVFRRNGCIFLSGNTGKTRAALFAFDYLRQQGVVNKLLVVAPLSTLRRTWAQEVLQTFVGMRWRVLHGPVDKRLKLLGEDADVYIVNHDGLPIILPEVMKRTDINMVVYDELTAIKNKTSERWKTANALFRMPHLVRLAGMTGLATPQAPTDAYGQIKALTPRALDGISYSRFRDLTMRKITNFKYLPRQDANDTVFRYMQPAIRFTRDQCVDLPPIQYVDYECKLSPEQKKLFDELKREFHAQLAAGEITVQNEADKINKMVQVVTGCVYRSDGSVHYLDCSPRLAVLDDIVDAAAGKIIVFVPYKHSLAMLNDHMTHRSIVTGVVSGDTPVTKRDEIFRRFMDDPTMRVLIAHPACMSHGLTLTSASVVTWWGLPPSVEIYEQANARITRPGQTRHQYIAHIVATSLEVTRYRQLEQKVDTAGLLMTMVKNRQLAEVL